MSSAVVTAPDPCSETDEEVLLDAFGCELEVGIKSGFGAKFEPVLPVGGS
jgi:hypothetical protein